MRLLRAGLAALLAASAAPAVAEDLLFTFKASRHLDVLDAYNRQPYWALLAECGGVYGALANRYEDRAQAAQGEVARAEGVRFARLAMSQLNRDRGLGEKEALALIRERVDRGRDIGIQLLSERPAREHAHEQFVEMFCTQITDAHTSALRFSKR